MFDLFAKNFLCFLKNLDLLCSCNCQSTRTYSCCYLPNIEILLDISVVLIKEKMSLARNDVLYLKTRQQSTAMLVAL